MAISAYPSSNPMLLLFTDLDGTLIDHYTYSAEAARPALRLLTDRQIPLIFCSSKTWPEQLYLQQSLGLQGPMIVENGSAILLPDRYFSNISISDNVSRNGFVSIPLADHDSTGIRRLVRFWREHFGWPLYGYADCTREEIETATGLSGSALDRATRRDYTETLIRPMPDDVRRALQTEAKLHGIQLMQGGRFVTLQSEGVDKGRALRHLANLYASEYRTTVQTAAIGDSANDREMLEAADFGFLVQRPDKTWSSIELSSLQRIPAVGPAGFNLAVSQLINEIC